MTIDMTKNNIATRFQVVILNSLKVTRIKNSGEAGKYINQKDKNNKDEDTNENKSLS